MTENNKNYLLQNQRFMEHYSKLKELKDAEEMLDVTLACDDYAIVKAHRVVISSSSSFFRNVINMSGHQNPFIYIKGVTSEDLESIINFVYTGEAKVPAENIVRFMEAAKELKIDGLVNDENVIEPMIDVTDTVQHEKRKKSKKVRRSKTVPTEEAYSESQPELNFGEEEVALDAEKPDAEFVFEDALSKKYTRDKQDGKVIYNCTDCDKKYFTRQKVKFHVESHLEGQFVHNCNLCGTQLKSKKSFEMHKLNKHSKARATQLIHHNLTF